jgi:hypothetical protein
MRNIFLATNWIAFCFLIFTTLQAEEGKPGESMVRFVEEQGSVRVRIGEQEVAKYVYNDPAVGRPYWCDVRTMSGIPVTRNHPPVKGVDLDDHVGLHTGIWVSFGDLSGNDYWRLKAKTRHEKFAVSPREGEKESRFVVVNHYLSSDGSEAIASEINEFRIVVLSDDDYLLDWKSRFEPVNESIYFGDQEEMGLGIRVAKPLVVDSKQGGRMLDSEGRLNGKAIWGKTASWCDYAGPSDGKWVGLTVLASADNFRPCWCHARDYGFLALNPFGRKAFTQGEVSKVEVKKGEQLQLRYGILVHKEDNEKEFRIDEAQKYFK